MRVVLDLSRRLLTPSFACLLVVLRPPAAAASHGLGHGGQQDGEEQGLKEPGQRPAVAERVQPLQPPPLHRQTAPH